MVTLTGPGPAEARGHEDGFYQKVVDRGYRRPRAIGSGPSSRLW
ncbi:MAG: hypothetical protein AVDCRST_MAG05-4629 [uncultured Rubrobacteraceae bacterium]|uniref:Uncharacterized protein n=1 Tax=uncultured Rubrobacteraceae bacterium TaxID=349277 RepID=A0A6J4TXI5_9ACTN|nr:MAG: hypothetical protein AVDCRST_MAG05-4629 [uncultured Rubrobacteraceae bacterium]